MIGGGDVFLAVALTGVCGAVVAGQVEALRGAAGLADAAPRVSACVGVLCGFALALRFLLTPFTLKKTLAPSGVDGAECAIVATCGEPAGRRQGWSDGIPRPLLRPKKLRMDYPPPFPNGWYVVMPAHELPAGQSRYVRMVGQHVAVFRTEGGHVAALYAFCPHLGANLGVAAKVKGETVACPFHGWEFNGDGKCVDIPYSSSCPPSNAHTKSFTVRELNGFILLWFDAEGRPPAWDVPAVPELGPGSKHVLHGQTTHLVSSHIANLPANGADRSHFEAVHSEHVSSWFQTLGFSHAWKPTWELGENTPGGERHTAVMTVEQSMSWRGKRVPGSTTHTTVFQIGPGFVFFRFSTALGNLVVFETVTPIAPLLQRVHHLVFASPTVPRFVAKVVLQGMIVQYERDAMVFNNQRWTSKPVLVQEDANLARFRTWWRQFYSASSASAVTAGTLDW